MNVITSLLAMLEVIAPTISGSGTVQTVINTLLQIVPVLIKEYQDVMPSVNNIITSLKTNSDITKEQWTQLEELEKIIDADFEDAAKAAEAEDKA